MDNNFGKKMSNVLESIEIALLERNSNPEVIKPNYTNEGFRAALYIFMDVLIDKMYSLNQKEKHDLVDSSAMAESAGKELAKFVHTWTGIKSENLYK